MANFTVKKLIISAMCLLLITGCSEKSNPDSQKIAEMQDELISLKQIVEKTYNEVLVQRQEIERLSTIVDSKEVIEVKKTTIIEKEKEEVIETNTEETPSEVKKSKPSTGKVNVPSEAAIKKSPKHLQPDRGDASPLEKPKKPGEPKPPSGKAVPGTNLGIDEKPDKYAETEKPNSSEKGLDEKPVDKPQKQTSIVDKLFGFMKKEKREDTSKEGKK